MFGVTLGKLIALVVAIVALWRLIAFVQRMSGPVVGQRRAPPSGRARPESPQASVELVACPHCGTYIPKGEPCPGPQRCVHRSAA